jgi:hypothetical protein
MHKKSIFLRKSLIKLKEKEKKAIHPKNEFMGFLAEIM